MNKALRYFLKRVSKPVEFFFFVSVYELVDFTLFRNSIFLCLAYEPVDFILTHTVIRFSLVIFICKPSVHAKYVQQPLVTVLMTSDSFYMVFIVVFHFRKKKRIRRQHDKNLLKEQKPQRYEK